MSVWLFDLGNTRLKCAPLHADGSLGDVIALAHGEAEIAAALADALPERIDVAHVSCVASGPLRIALLEALTQRCGRIGLARTQARFAGLQVAYAQPGRLGVDRFLALVAARARGGAALVCGIGTALTLDLLDADGRHRGGRIAPSPTLMREVLHQRAPQLPVAGGTYSEFASDTDDGLASGCDGAALALIERSLAAGRDVLGSPPRLIVHGGGVEPLLAQLAGAEHAPSLVLEGLAHWAAVENT